MRVPDGQIHSGRCPIISIHSHLYILLLYELIAIPDLDIHLYRPSRRASVRDEHFCPYIGLLFRYFILDQIDTGRSIIGQRDIDRIRDNQIYVPVDTSIEVKIADQRHDILLQGVVDLHQYPVVGIIFHFIRNLEYKGAISPTVFADMDIIDENIRDCIGSFKTQKEAFAFPFGFYKQRFGIIRDIQ